MTDLPGQDLLTTQGPKGKWQIRIMSKEPTLIQDKEILFESTMRPVLGRCYLLVRRTSYMVNGPNREVWWAIDRWNWKVMGWTTVLEGKSRLREGGSPA